MRVAIVMIPLAATVNNYDDTGTVALLEQFDMNGETIEIQSEHEYYGECGIDWEKYDFVTPINEADAYSWRKSWLKDIRRI